MKLIECRDTELNTQESENRMVNALKTMIRWLVFGSKLNPWDRWHPARGLVHWYSTRQMDDYLRPELDRHIAKSQDPHTAPSKSIISLALQTYLAEDPSRKSVADTFKTFAISQIKQFLFSGHDTTSSTMCYVFHLLSTNPIVLGRVRDEHTRVLGPDMAAKIKRLQEEPHLLNQLSYSVAVIKETMRLFPVASTVRGGEPGFYVKDDDGQSYPTDGFLVWGVSQPLHRDKNYWSQPEAFMPDRFLVGPDDPLYPVKGAFRPFEFGPRNCIGQELAMMELKVAMVLVLQLFNIEVAYDDTDRQLPRSPNIVDGERAYQLTMGAPSDGLPCKLKLSKGADRR